MSGRPQAAATGGGDIVIEVLDASVALDGATLLDPISLSVAPGEAVVVRGPNGAGKTTLLRLVTGQLAATSGTVVVAQRPPSLREPGFRRTVAAMLGLPPFARDVTIAEHATLVATTWWDDSTSAQQHVHDVLTQLGLSRLRERFPHELSSGQLQLAGLALSFVRPCEVLVLDEPEQRLDAERLGLVTSLLRTRKEQGVSVLIASHSDRVAAEVGAREVRLAEAR